MNRGGFSWRGFSGISAAKAHISRQIGIPLTRSGRQRKLGRAMGCMSLVVPVVVVVIVAARWLLGAF